MNGCRHLGQSVQLNALVEARASYSVEIIAEGLPAGRGYLHGASALSDRLCGRAGERRIFVDHFRMLVPSERASRIRRLRLWVQLLVDRLTPEDGGGFLLRVALISEAITEIMPSLACPFRPTPGPE
jgi:hypothetical protein